MFVPAEHKYNGRPLPYSIGGYPMIYWGQNDDGELYAYCYECAEDESNWDIDFYSVESGDAYGESFPCENCGRELAAHVEATDKSEAVALPR